MKLNELTNRLLLTSPILLSLGALSPGQAAEGTLRVRFLDSATGYAIQPEAINVVTDRAGARAQRPPVRAVSRSGHLALALAKGQHTLEVGAANYFPLAGQVVAGESDQFNINFVLDPILPPRELQNDYIDTLRRADATVFVGFVADEETGQPLRHVRVRSLPSGVVTQTDERGFFQIHVPLSGAAVSSSLLLEKGGYRTHERQHLELWANGDWIYRISLVPGNGREVVDERTTRRHSPSGAVGITVRETSPPASREATVSAASESTGVTADGPISASSTSNLVVRVPRTIRVLRQDNVNIDHLSLETYTKRVLPSEWFASWAGYGGGSGINSLKAGAVAVRTFGAGYVSNPLTNTYDICGTTACQAYVHTANNSSANTAVDQAVSYIMLPPGAVRITFKLTEYSAENNALGLTCGDGFSGNSGSCIADPVCTGETRNGHGRGMCQWGTAKWATGLKFPGNNFSNTSLTNGQPKQDWTWICEHYYPAMELVQGAPLTNNDIVKVLGTSSITVRECAGGSISNGINCPEITTKPSGSTGVIIGGPVQVTSDGRGYTWWRVQWHDSGPTVGWSPENWLERTTEPPNVPPVLAPIPDMVVNEGSLLTFTNSTTASPTTDIVITDFEGFASGTANGTVLFRQPSFSGSTSGLLDASPNSTSVTGTFPAGHDSSRVLRANWSWNTTVNAWLRLTTFNTANLPNPVTDLNRKLIFDIFSDRDVKVAMGVRETGNPAGTPIGADGGTTPSIIEFVGVNNVISGQPQCVRTVTASNWTTLTFDLPNESVRNFSGGNGVLSTPTGLGTLEHLAFVPVTGSGAYDVYHDNFIVSAPKVLTYSLSNAPSGATINATNGVFTWTPTEAQGPGVYNIMVKVTDNSSPPLSDSKSFNVTVNEVNVAPVLAAITDKSVDEQTLLSFVVSASDADIPTNTLTFSLTNSPPAGAAINPGTGQFTWTPTESQGPGVYSVAVKVTDNGTPPLSDTRTFSVTVNEVNTAPTLAAIANRTVHAGITVTVANSATDPDLPANTLTYSLDPGAPPGATIGPASGLFTWPTADVHAGGSSNITVRVTDNGLPPMEDARTFSVNVVSRPVIQTISVSGGNVTLTWTAITGGVYRVQYKSDVGDPAWTNLVPDVTATGPTASKADPLGPGQRLYRVQVLD